MNVNAIAPGYVRTDNTHALQDDPTRAAQYCSSSGSPPAGGPTPTTSPERSSFSRAAASDYVSGIVLPVDGGWLGR